MSRQFMNIVHEAAAQWQLNPGTVRRLAAARRGRWLEVTSGRLWLTRTGAGPVDGADVWLTPSQRHWLPAGSEWVIEGVGDVPCAAFVLLEAPPVSMSRPALRVRLAWRGSPKAASRPGCPSLPVAACSSAS